MSRPERMLFGGSVVRRIGDPENRIARRVPTYGVRGATHLELSILWRAVILVGALIWIIGQFFATSLEVVGAVIFVVGVVMSFRRAATGARAGRSWRDAGHGSADPG